MSEEFLWEVDEIRVPSTLLAALLGDGCSLNGGRNAHFTKTDASSFC